MHELSIAQSLLDVLEETAIQHHLSSICRVTIKVGRLRQIVPDFLKLTFETIAEGSVAEHAVLDVIQIPIVLQCQACHETMTLERPKYICSKCQSKDLNMISGKELTIEKIEGE